MKYGLVGQRTPDGYRMTYADFTPVNAQPLTDSTDPVVQLESEVWRTEPNGITWLYAGPAAPLSITGLESAVSAFRERAQSVPGIEQDAVASSLLDAVSQVEFWQKRFGEDWQPLAQLWDGVSFSTTYLESRTIRSVYPQWGEVREQLLIGIERELGPDHVRLVYRRSPPPEITRAQLRELWKGEAVDKLLAQDDTTVGTETIYLTDCDPRTLIPKRFVKQFIWYISRRQDEQPPQLIQRTETWTHEFVQLTQSE